MQKKLLFSLILIILSLLLILFISCTTTQENDKDVSHIKDTDKDKVTEIKECEHSFSEWEEIKTPSCTQSGQKVRTCSKCDLVDIEYLSKLPHNAKLNKTIVASCAHEGYSVYLCECGYTYNSAYIAPLGHSLKKETVIAKTCFEAGYTHYQCSRCDYNFDADFIPQSHSFQKTVTHTTATQSGFTTYTCKDCSYHYDNDFIQFQDILPSPYVEITEPLCKGLDIYEEEHKTDNNGNYLPIDWESIKAQGYDFVILKVGSDVSGKSPTFDMDYEGAKAAGLGVGAYYYAYSSTVSGTRNDAQEVLEWIKGKQFEYPIYYDIEEKYLSNNLSKDSLTELITVFIEELQANGYYSALYCNNNWLVNKLDTQTMLERFDLWYARYPGTEDPTWNEELYGKTLSMWQFSKKGIVEGFDTEIDLNYCYRDYPSLMKKWGFNGFEKEPVVEEDNSTQDNTEDNAENITE